MKRLVALVLVLSGCEGELEAPRSAPVPEPVVSVTPALDEAALIARGLAFRTGGFRQMSRRYDSKGAVGASIEVWVSDDALNGYPTIDPDAEGSQASIPVGAMIVREVFNAQGELKKLTFVAQGPAGYNPLSGDLWFAVTDPGGRILAVNGVSQHGALASCSGCHAGRARDGYLFGVPRAQQRLTVEEQTDAGDSATADAGTVVVDAGVTPFDAGLLASSDAGPVDAGRTSLDAGTRADAGIVDAGTLDAGMPLPDAGLTVPDAGLLSFDLSNFSLVNLEAALLVPQSATFDTVELTPGKVLVVGRDATRAQFEAYWRVTLGSNVLYANAQATGGHDAPIINGGEVWALMAPGNRVVDGPSLPGAANQSYRRTAMGWVERPMSSASPGIVESDFAVHGLRLTEWSDAADFHMEFVELSWAP